MILALGFASIQSAGHYLAESRSPTEWNSTLKLNWDPPSAIISKALEHVPGNAENRYRFARKVMQIRVADEKQRQAVNEKVIAALAAALCANPSRADVWRDLGYRFSYKTYDAYQYMSRWLPVADRCFDAAVRFAPDSGAACCRRG